MFDYRYHALSLAAVLLALAIGVLIGVAIGDSNLVSSARDGIVKNLRAEVGESQHHTEQVSTKLSEEEALANDLYPIAVNSLLSGHDIGLVFLGEPSDQIDEAVRDAVTQAGGSLRAVVAVREPLDAIGVGAQAAGTLYAALPTEPSLTRRFAVRMGKEIVKGGTLLGAVHTRLFSSDDGELGGIDGVVVVRDEPKSMTGPEASSTPELKATRELESGLLAGIAAEQVPAVGVELTSTEPSQVGWYQSEDLSSVDDLDTLAGRAALAFALAGNRGAYGVKPSADSLLPHVRPPR
ncbi:MAG: copper transporter [Solirubrobacteraceae bacterium]